jgi:hypothetical protein
VTRETMRRKAFEAGLELVEDPEARAQVLEGTHKWWKYCAPLTPAERQKILSDVQEFARATNERTAQAGKEIEAQKQAAETIS